MAMRKADTVQVEVDMVPLIDIISLLLMFLVMVGDMAQSTTSVKMTLPRASEAKSDKEVDSHNRLVVQLEKDSNGKYWANIEKNRFELGLGNEGVRGQVNGTLIKFLNDQIIKLKAHGDIKDEDLGGIKFPVKLRIPDDAPMREAERLIQTMAQAKLVNVQYASQVNKGDKK